MRRLPRSSTTTSRSSSPSLPVPAAGSIPTRGSSPSTCRSTCRAARPRSYRICLEREAYAPQTSSTRSRRKDGTAIALFQNTVPLEPLYGNKQALFDATKFEWLGSPSREFAVFAIWHTAPVNKIEDARNHELVVGAPGSNSSPAFYGRLFESIFGIKVKILAGYQGAAEVLLGTERGENDGNSSAYWSSLNSIRPTWVAEKKLKFLLQYGPHPIPGLDDVPYALDLIADPFKREMMEVASAPLGLGRPIAAPPGVPRNRVEALRKGLVETFDDPDYRSECTKLRLNCDEPVAGEIIADGLARGYAASPEVIRELRRIYNAQ